MAAFTREPVELNAVEQRTFELIRAACEDDIRRMAKLLAGKRDSELFGQTEFELRDRVHALGAKALETVADERQKKRGVTKKLAASVGRVTGTPAVLLFVAVGSTVCWDRSTSSGTTTTAASAVPASLLATSS